MLDKLSKKTGIIKSELTALLFIACSFLLGLSIKVSGVLEADPKKYDYSKRDSLFAASIEPADKEIIDEAPADSIKGKKSKHVTKEKTVKLPKGSALKDSSIDINRATIEDFSKLPGIGTKTAENIIEYREQIGLFSDIEQLKNITGIGSKKFENIRKFIFAGK